MKQEWFSVWRPLHKVMPCQTQDISETIIDRIGDTVEQAVESDDSWSEESVDEADYYTQLDANHIGKR